MTKTNKFSLILMHDDGRTHRMRVSRGLFRLLVTLLVLAPLLGILGLWVGFEAWRTMSVWQQERTAYQLKVDDMRVQLERLSTLEALLKTEEGANGPLGPALAGTTTPMPQTSPAAPTAASPVADAATGQNNAAQASPSQPNTPQAAGAATATTGAGPAGAPTSTAATTSVTAGAASTDPALTGPNAESAITADNAEGEAPPDERRKAVNTGTIRVENMQARLIDRRRLRASVDLYNAEANGRQLGGRTVFSLLTADGRQFPLSNEDAAFRISRFKKVVTTSTLPVPASELENAAIVVEVNVGGKLVYRNLFSIETR